MLNLKKILAMFIVANCSLYSKAQKTEKSNTPKTPKNSIIIPDEIKKQVPKEQQELIFFNLIWQLLKNNYVDRLTNLDILEKAIKGVLNECDTHTSFLDEKTLKTLQETTNGEFGGLGIEIVPIEGFIKILHPLENSPALKAGLKPGDMITHVNGEFIYKELPELVIRKLKGKPGTFVTLTIKRRMKAPFDIRIKRETIKMPYLKSEIYNDIGYLRISSFYQNLAKDTRKAVATFQKNKNLKGVVIDIRYNSGGLLNEAVGLSNLFLPPRKEIVSIIGRTKDVLNKKTIYSDRCDILKGLPIVVLINSGSASASEIFAAALKENNRALIVGEESFGKGSVQNVIPLPGGNVAIKLTIAKFYVNNKCIQYNGVTPDITAKSKIIKDIPDLFEIREKDISKEYQKLHAQKKKNTKMTKESSKEIISKLDVKKSKDEEKEEDDPILLLFKPYKMEERMEKDQQLISAMNALETMHHMQKIRNCSKITGIKPPSKSKKKILKHKGKSK